ncbi:hypothetical protein ES702_04119 [subsurface metagenome]
MKKRKLPIRHKVRTHTRNGKRVRSYMRGKGKSESKPYIGKLRHEGSSRKTMEDYKIIFYYSKKRKETVKVAARDSDDALSLALKRRKRKGLKPLKIMVIDGVGAILGTIAGAVAGGVHSALVAFRAQHAKGAEERAKLTQLREESEAKKKAWLEETAKKMLDKARAGNRPSQIWCEKHHIAWEQV